MIPYFYVFIACLTSKMLEILRGVCFNVVEVFNLADVISSPKT